MKYLLVIITIFLAISCGPILPAGVPSCEESMTNFYNQGCTWTDADGEAETLEEVTQECEEYIAHITSREGNTCLVFTIDLLFCLHNLDSNDSCDSCNDELRMIEGCMPEDNDNNHRQVEFDNMINSYDEED